ncbi:MAG: endolytic transglycosylase MltG [Candidatus Kapaibacteriales bacterium]
MRYLIGLLTALFIAFGGIYFYTNYKLSETYNTGESLQFEIPKGATSGEAIDILNGKGVLSPNWFYNLYFKFYLKTQNQTMKAGFYEMPGTVTAEAIIKELVSGGSAKTKMVTVPEGLTSWEIASIFKKELGVDSLTFMQYLRNDSLLSAHDISAPSAEGYLFPETYEFYEKFSNAQIIVEKMIEEGERFWNTSEEIASSGLLQELTKHETLTMASIVEAETGDTTERAIVSGLYHNRLSMKMPLQANPTVQYGIGEKNRLLNKDLKHDSPFNTYLINGLPPGPINNPGRRAIVAAANPAEHNYIYMVAIGDGSGRHKFSTNQKDHNTYVQQYYRQRRNQ